MSILGCLIQYGTIKKNYNIFNEFLEDISEDELPNEALGFNESRSIKNKVSK